MKPYHQEKIFFLTIISNRGNGPGKRHAFFGSSVFGNGTSRFGIQSLHGTSTNRKTEINATQDL